MVRVPRKLPLLFPHNIEAMSVDSGRQRLRPNPRLLALQLPFIDFSESMSNHDSKIVGADSVD
jgi:hypothetical protein